MSVPAQKMNTARPEHSTRIATGLGLAACLAVCITVGGLLARLLVLLVSSVALWEYLAMHWPGSMHFGRKIVGLTTGAAIVLSQALGPQYTLLAVLLSFCFISLIFLFDYGTGNALSRLEHYAPLTHGIVYIPLVLQSALYLSRAEQCLVVAAAIATDAGGYYAGSCLGKNRMWPSVSPKKTWEGCAGGIILCVLICMLCAFLSRILEWSLPALSFWTWGLLGLLCSLSAQLGDFFESSLKRSLNTKDSGNLLPGHGGMLDRIDSVLFVLPVYFLVRMLLTGM
jgi:phosphatidate cytidylyltransferase